MKLRDKISYWKEDLRDLSQKNWVKDTLFYEEDCIYISSLREDNKISDEDEIKIINLIIRQMNTFKNYNKQNSIIFNISDFIRNYNIIKKQIDE